MTALGDLAVLEDMAKPKPTVESMLAGILEAQVLIVSADEKPREQVSISIERDIRSGCLKVVDRVTGIGGDQRRTLTDAVESLYLRLAEKASGERRKATEMLRRLGVPEPKGGP